MLFVVPEARRAAAVLRLVEDADLAPLVWVATRDRIALPGDLSAPIWDDGAHSVGRALSE